MISGNTILVEEKMYTRSDILKDLESIGKPNPHKLFPDLSDGYLYLSGSRINLYADDQRWAIVFEKSGYGNRSGIMQLEIIYFGNCLRNLDKAGLNNVYTSNTKWFESLISIQDLENIETDFELVSPNAKTIKIRNENLPIEHDPKKYVEKGIEINDYENPNHLIDFAALTRYLNEEFPEYFRATEEELRTCLPKDLPKLMVINKWHHRDYYVSKEYPNPEKGTRPSEYETFPLIAEVLVSKDTTKWKPILKPNNDWRNWPMSGGM